MIALREIEVDKFFKTMGKMAGEAELTEACADVVSAHVGLVVRSFGLIEVGICALRGLDLTVGETHRNGRLKRSKRGRVAELCIAGGRKGLKLLNGVEICEGAG